MVAVLAAVLVMTASIWVAICLEPHLGTLPTRATLARTSHSARCRFQHGAAKPAVRRPIRCTQQVRAEVANLRERGQLFRRWVIHSSDRSAARSSTAWSTASAVAASRCMVLESRLDNVVYRAGFAKSRDMARQLVTHGHLTVNGRKVDIPSYRVAENDIVEVRPKSRDMTPFVVAQAEAGERQVPAWLEVVPDQMRILVHALPVRAQIDTQVQEQLIVELYSK